ncbi:hypothetical protein FRC03_004258 [Tulasnella sp. 419]|nr:hypothetical protein FRC03_004258 [Tulasnella sp. 419]
MPPTRIPLGHPAFLDFDNRRSNPLLNLARQNSLQVVELRDNRSQFWVWPLFMDAFCPSTRNPLSPVPTRYLQEYCQHIGIDLPHCLCGYPSRIEPAEQTFTSKLEYVACCKYDLCGYLGKLLDATMNKNSGLTVY